jgi:photosystem II stability/assembly factor-like uncharacterized protein
VNPGLTNTFVNALAIDAATPATLYAGTNGGDYKSIDEGTSWTAFNSGLEATYITALAIDPATAATLYATSYGSVFKSTNGGTSWQPTGSSATAIKKARGQLISD